MSDTADRDASREPPPPRLALWLAERFVPEHEREFLVGDLVEEFHRAGGSWPARRRFWREAIIASLRRERDLDAIPFQRGLMTDIGFDLRLALRRLRRTPGFTLTTSLTLALGVGAAIAIAAVVGPALWGPLPFRDAERVVTLRERFGDGSRGNVGYATVTDVARRVPSLEFVAAGASWQPTLRQGEGAFRLQGTSITADWMNAMGTRVALGRGFLPEEDRPEAPRVVVLSHGIWEQYFGGDSTVIGRSIPLSDVMHQVVGVMPVTHEDVLQQEADILRPLRYADTLPWACRDCRHLQGVARLRRGVPIATAQAELARAFESMRAEYPEPYGQNGIVLTQLRERVLEGVRGPMYALLGTAALLLVIALANATNLHLARAVRRGGEATVRAALGASRWRLMRGTLIEALLTSTLGALFGLAMASAAIASLVALAPSSLPRIAQVRMDGFTWALASGLALLLGMVSGMIPAMLDGSRELHRRISANSRTVARGGHDVMRRSLVMVEIALALVLLAGAGVLVQSVRRLLAVDTGFAADGRLTMLLSVGGPRYDFDAAVHQTWRAVLEGVSAISGVTSAALTSQLPMSSDFDTYGLRMRREEGRDRADAVDGFRFAVSADYAKAMGLRVRRGRFSRRKTEWARRPSSSSTRNLRRNSSRDGTR